MRDSIMPSRPAPLSFALAVLVSSVLAQKPPVSNKPDRLTAKQAEKLFLDEIEPILKKKCVGCHSEGDYREGELDLRTREAMLRGGDSGKSVIPGDGANSLLHVAVTWKDKELRMPPKERNRLTLAQTDAIRRWIDAGAPWPVVNPLTAPVAARWEAENAKGIRVATSGGLSPDWTDRRYKPEDLWSYRPIRRPEVPKLKDETGVAN
ncbi:MAG: hypothetical protein N2C14_01180, partial [Planctomycetales bacterium]